jgi:hypothetical protein
LFVVEEGRFKLHQLDTVFVDSLHRVRSAKVSHTLVGYLASRVDDELSVRQPVYLPCT